MADGKVTIDTSLNNKGLVKGIGRIKGEFGGLESVVRKLGAVIASVFAVRAIVNFSKECIELGSNVAEVQNVVDVAFGDMTDKVETFAAGAIRNFGMSQLAAKKTASTYMAMAKGMGVADETAADMSITLAGLTGDVASFYNISQELADIKLKSVFTGETETLKDLGVVMTQDNLAAYALAQGITKSYDAMTQAEKVALRYNFVLDSLALANGDFARTSNSWANQTRILSMQWQEFMGIMGRALITVLTPVVKTLNQIVSGLISVANTFNSVISSVFGGANTQIQQTQANASAVGGAISGAVDNQEALTDATRETAKAQKKLLAGFDEINKLSGGAASEVASNSGAGIQMPSGGSVAAEIEVVQNPTSDRIVAFFKDLKESMQPTIDALGRLWHALWPFGRVVGQGLVWFYKEALLPLAAWSGDAFIWALDEITSLLTNLTGLLSGKKTFVDFLGDLSSAQTILFGIAAALAAVKIATAGMAVLNGLAAIKTFIVSIQALKATSLLGKLAEVFLLVSSGAGTLSESMKLVFGKGSIIAGIGAIVGGAVLALTNFFSMLKNGFSWVREALMILGVALAAVGAIILGAPALVAGVVAAVVAAVATAAVVIKEHWVAIKEFGVAAWLAIKEAFSKAANWFKTNVMQPIKEGFKGFVNGLIGYVESFINFFVRGINKIINTVNALSFDIPDIMGGGKIGFNLRNVGEIKLPRLAQGAVIPPNREFLAVLGDQKSGTNIETPLATMVEAFKTAMQSMNMNTGKNEAALIVDGQKLGKLVYQLYNREDRRVGVSLIKI